MQALADTERWKEKYNQAKQEIQYSQSSLARLEVQYNQIQYSQSSLARLEVNRKTFLQLRTKSPNSRSFRKYQNSHYVNNFSNELFKSLVLNSFKRINCISSSVYSLAKMCKSYRVPIG